MSSYNFLVTVTEMDFSVWTATFDTPSEVTSLLEGEACGVLCTAINRWDGTPVRDIDGEAEAEQQINAERIAC